MTYTSYQFQTEILLHLLKLCASSIVISTRDVAAMSKYAQKIIFKVPRQYVPSFPFWGNSQHIFVAKNKNWHPYHLF